MQIIFTSNLLNIWGEITAPQEDGPKEVARIAQDVPNQSNLPWMFPIIATPLTFRAKMQMTQAICLSLVQSPVIQRIQPVKLNMQIFHQHTQMTVKESTFYSIFNLIVVYYHKAFIRSKFICLFYQISNSSSSCYFTIVKVECNVNHFSIE